MIKTHFSYPNSNLLLLLLLNRVCHLGFMFISSWSVYHDNEFYLLTTYCFTTFLPYPIFFFKDFIYPFMRDTQRERGRDTGRGRSRLHAGSPTWELILGLQDHTLGWRRCETAEPPRLPHIRGFLWKFIQQIFIEIRLWSKHKLEYIETK